VTELLIRICEEWQAEEEISRRVADIDSGKAKMIPWEELSSRLKRNK
jgi:putative addiction module component (TIGR02574 family)